MPDEVQSVPGFAPFSLLHACMVCAFVVVTGGLVAWGRSRRGKPELRRLELALGGFNLVWWFVVTAWWLRPDNFTWGRALPLHLCDLASLLAPLAMIVHRRGFSAVLYYWGLGLCSQAFITPTLTDGPADVYFWMFWYQHTAIVGGAAYEVGVRGFLPTWRDLVTACLASYVFLAVAMGVNELTGGNYGYVGRSQPSAPTIVDALGAWPLRVVWIALLVHVVYAVLTVPGWYLRRGRAIPGEQGREAHATQSPA